MKPVLFKLTIAFDGTPYAGWQIQKTGVAVQEIVTGAVRRLFPNATPLEGSSRTDAGVHAFGLAAHVGIPPGELRMPARKVARALNAFLPKEIRIMTASRCRGPFHARFDASGKQYRYFIWNGRSMNPLLNERAWHAPKPLDLAAMRAAAKLLIGRRDFKSFAGAHGYEIPSTIRTVTRCDVRKNGALLTFIIEGDGFLYKMCRTMVGTLAQVGHGKFGLPDVERMLAGKSRALAGMTAPAHGLVLWKVFYNKKTDGHS